MRALVVGSVCSLLLACPLEPELTSIEDGLFGPSCAYSSCHQGSRPPRDLNLSSSNTWAGLVGQPSSVEGILLVEPGFPDESLLMLVLEGPYEDIRQMPPGSPLGTSQLQAVREWIALGANND